MIHHTADFLGMGFGQRSAKNGKVLAENKNQAPIDVTETRDYTVTRYGLIVH